MSGLLTGRRGRFAKNRYYKMKERPCDIVRAFLMVLLKHIAPESRAVSEGKNDNGRQSFSSGNRAFDGYQ